MTGPAAHLDPEVASCLDDGQELSLAELGEGESAVVARLEGSSVQLGERLSARGLAPGMEVTVVRAGDPLVVAAGRSRWGIARHEAVRIGVARLALSGGLR